MSEQTNITDTGGQLKKSSQEIFNSCSRVYGTCTDGSFEACLAHEGYYEVLKAEKDEQ